MTIEQFKTAYAHLRDVDKVMVDDLCDHPNHIAEGLDISKGPAKRNILKHGGKEFVCRACDMKHNNPMNKVGESRQTEEVISVFCPCPDHEGDNKREMKKNSYYGEMEEPYLQICKSCAQLGKIISEDQKEAIRQALTGIKRSDEFKQKLSDYMSNNPEGIARAAENLIPGSGGGWNKGQITPDDVREKQSQAMSGRTYSEEHRQNISDGRKKMLAETGGFTREHCENISKATREQYRRGFNPKLHHISGWHTSPKSGDVFFRSSYEKKAYLKLDDDKDVAAYKAEAITVEYYHPIKHITSGYLIDLSIEYIDGSVRWVEIKPEKWLTDEVVICKIDAAELAAIDAGVPFEVWTEIHLFGHVYNKKNMQLFIDKIKRGEV